MLMTKNEIKKLIRETLMLENENSTPNIKKIQDILKKKSGNFRGEQIFPDVFKKFQKEKILPDNKEDRKNLVTRIVEYILKEKINENLINQAHEEILSLYPELKKEIPKKFPKSKENTLTEGDNSAQNYESFYNNQKQKSVARFGNIGSLASYGEEAPDSGVGGIIADTGFTLTWELASGPIGDVFGIGFGTYDAIADHQQRNEINNYLEKNKGTLTKDQEENLQDLEFNLLVSEVINIAVVVILAVVVIGTIATGGVLAWVAGATIGLTVMSAGGLAKALVKIFKGAKKAKSASTPLIATGKAAAEKLKGDVDGDDEPGEIGRVPLGSTR